MSQKDNSSTTPPPEKHSSTSHLSNIEKHLEHISQEFRDGFEILHKYPRSVTIFGSSQTTPESSSYKKAEQLAHRIVKDLNYAVITGGGPGIMTAANKGASEAGGQSIGLAITLPSEQHHNLYSTDNMLFRYFFSRKTMLGFAAEAYIFFPGGFGTFDELFNMLTLVQTEKIPRVPIILFDSNFWKGLEEFMRNHMLAEYRSVDARDLGLFEITDSFDRVIEVIKQAPVADWWRHIN